MLPVNNANHQIARLIFSFCSDLQQHWIIPKKLRLCKVNVVLCAVGFTFGSVKLENMHGIKTIP